MASKRTVFAQFAEIERCKDLADYYILRGWRKRAARVLDHVERLRRQMQRKTLDRLLNSTRPAMDMGKVDSIGVVTVVDGDYQAKSWPRYYQRKP